MTNDRQDGGSGVDEALYIACSRNKIQMSIYIYNSTIFYINIHAYSLMVYNSLQYHVYQVSLLSLDPLHTSYN